MKTPQPNHAVFSASIEHSFASLSFHGGNWWWAIAAGAALLIPLAWFAWSGGSRRSGLAVFFRWLGIALLLFYLADPRWTTQRPVKGANIVALLADNSQGLEIADLGETESRGDQLRQRLTEENASWRRDLSEDYQVRSYRFDQGLRRINDFSELDFAGAHSNLNTTLAQAAQRFQRLPLAGIVLFSDGNATDLVDGFTQLESLPPVYVVPVGSQDPLPDIRLSRVHAVQSAFDDAPLSIKVDVSAEGIRQTANASVSIRQIEAEQAALGAASETLPPTQTVRLNSEGRPSAISFDWRPSQPGIQFFEIEARSNNQDQTEATLRNNRRIVMADRGQTAYRILYVAGRPNWEYKFINRALSEDPQLEMSAIIRVARREPKFDFKGRAGESSNPLYRGFGREDETERYDQPVIIRMNTRDENELLGGFPATAEELFAYDAVVVDDVEAEFFTSNQLGLLRRFVAERGGGLLALGGAEALESGNYHNTPLAAALPVYLDRTIDPIAEYGARWKLTREGWVEPWTRVRSNEDDELDRLVSMPTFQVINKLTSLKPGARALAVADDTNGNLFPALITQNFGYGKTTVLTIGDFWRWGMRGEAEQADLARFWRQIARHLVTDVPHQVELTAQHRGAECIRLVATARNKEYRPLEIGSAKITITKVDRSENAEKVGFSEIGLVAEPVSDAPGRFQAWISSTETGAYRAKVEVTQADGQVVGSATTGWVIDSAVAEFQSLTPNLKALKEIADRTGGRVLDWSELGQLPALLEKQTNPLMEAQSTPLWHSSWAFIALLACLLAEWALRRKEGLA